MTDSFTTTIATALRDEAAALTGRWVELIDVSMHYRPRPESALDMLRDHGPRLIREIAAFVDGERGAPRSDMLEHLREMVTIRRERGHDVQELLREVDLLGEVLYDALRDLSVATEHSAAGNSDAARRLHRGLAVIGTMVAGLYEEHENTDRRAKEERAKRFRDDLAHEIKNPLGAALGALSTLAEEDIGDPALRDRMRGLAERNVRRALDLVDDLRTMAEDDGGAETQQPRSIQSLVEGVLAEVSDAAARNGVELRTPSPLPDVRIDGPRVQLALVNTAWNAIKYADPSKDERIAEICAALEGDQVVIHVRDNGVGIPPESVDRVFERFFRADPGRSNGSGLGLPIAREAVRQIGGDITVESEEGIGTTFRIRAPVLE